MEVQNLEDAMKTMLAGCGVCPTCGCGLLVKKTFFDECFSCYTTIWRPFSKLPKEEKK